MTTERILEIFVVCMVLCVLVPVAVYAGNVGKDCTFHGRRLYGRVQIVDSFADFKVRVVSSFPDLRVEKVSSFPNSCGKWQFVTSFPDFRIQPVDHFPDFSIQYVPHFPGVP
jgi:hypothetical protein